MSVTGDIKVIENKSGRAEFPVTHFRAVLNDDGDNLEEFLGNYNGEGPVPPDEETLYLIQESND